MRIVRTLLVHLNATAKKVTQQREISAMVSIYWQSSTTILISEKPLNLKKKLMPAGIEKL